MGSLYPNSVSGFARALYRPRSISMACPLLNGLSYTWLVPLRMACPTPGLDHSTWLVPTHLASFFHGFVPTHLASLFHGLSHLRWSIALMAWPIKSGLPMQRSKWINSFTIQVLPIPANVLP